MTHKNLIDAARIALEQCLALRHNEQLLVVCDEPCYEVGDALLVAGEQLCDEAIMVRITPRQQHAEEPPRQVAEWFKQFDVAVMPTSKSLSHTNARREACEAGVRIATLPGITTEMFARTMRTDWEALGRETRAYADALNAASTIHIRSDAGTDLSFERGDRTVKADDGRYTERGAFGNLPAGEAFMAPMEGTANGTLVVDGSFPLVGLLEQPLVLHVKDGRVTAVDAHPCAPELERIFDELGDNARNIAELGVGTLDTATLSGNVLEDEKVKGTIHIAIGDNASMGGTVHVPVHLDGVVRSPSVLLDGAVWMERGKVAR